jgi:hypothetical protein
MPDWTDEEALRWIQAAGGRLHRRKRPGTGDDWAVLLRTPTPRGGMGRLILGFGDSIAAAVEAARTGWDSVWREVEPS